MAHNQTQDRLLSLQLLRAIAAFMVVFHHAQAAANRISGAGVPVVNWGAAGVDVFFVISGFIMIYITQDRPARPLQFLFDRFGRIFPTYWLATAIIMVLASVSPIWNSPTDLKYALDSAFLIPSLRPDTANNYQPLIFQAWTLRLELYFYLLFAICIWLRSSKFALASLLILSTQYLFQIFNDVKIFNALINHNYIAIEFIMGMALGQIHVSSGPAITNHVETLARKLPLIYGVVLLAIPASFALIVISDNSVVPGLIRQFRPIAWGVPALIFTAAIVYLTPPLLNRLGIFRNVMMAMGDASYSIYLFHTMVITYFNRSFLLDGLNGGIGYALFIAACFAVSGLIGWLVFIAFEKPCVRLLKQFSRRSAQSSENRVTAE